MSLSNLYKDAALNLLRGTNATAPTTLRLALYTGTVGSGPEVSGGAYERQIVTFAAPVTDGVDRVIRNSAEVSFPEATASWGTVTHAKLIDTADVYVTLPLTLSKAIETDDTAVFAVNSVEVALQDA